MVGCFAEFALDECPYSSVLTICRAPLRVVAGAGEREKPVSAFAALSPWGRLAGTHPGSNMSAVPPASPSTETMLPVRWGVLGAGRFALSASLPGMKKGTLTQLHAIASRDIGKAKAAAHALGIPRAYGSYEELLEDPELEVIYNPLPNHLHVEWTARAARAGKHVLCEKPIALRAEEAE